MTTTVVVAVDDFSLTIESDAPEAPHALLVIAEMQQERLREMMPKIQRALEDTVLFGYGVVKLP
jgi:hypothetical protein